VHLDPLVLPDEWTPEQAFAVAEFLIALHDAIWDVYGWAIRDALHAPALGAPSGQLDLPLQDTGEPCF
jgi:hypothetical protein